MKKRFAELLFITGKHSMAQFFTSAKARSTSIEQHSGGRLQSTKEVLSNLKRSAHGLKKSPDGLLMKFTICSQTARINDGALLAGCKPAGIVDKRQFSFYGR